MHIITTAKGKDDGKKATLYYTYEFDSKIIKSLKKCSLLIQMNVL